MKDETLFGKRLDKRIKAIPNSWWFNIQQASIRGTPDRLGTVNGKFVALELKTSKSAYRSTLQEYMIGRLQMTGAYARFIWPEIMEEVIEDLEAMNE